ncbi:MAG: paraquat-inducible protein A [Paracoccaceae bacterium]|jgi:paraquat-inducible protein A
MTLKLANLSLLILFPIAWFAPLMKSGLLPFLSLTENSLMSSLQGIWAHDVFLALLMTFFAVFAPYIKVIGLALIHFELLSPKLLNTLTFIGRLAMADIFLIAIYIVVYTGISVAGVNGRVETAWGLYLFTGCVIASLIISLLSKRRMA